MPPTPPNSAQAVTELHRALADCLGKVMLPADAARVFLAAVSTFCAAESNPAPGWVPSSQGVRRASIEDAECVADLAGLMHAESPSYSPLPFSRDLMLPDALRWALDPMCCVLLAESGGHVVGCMAGRVRKHWGSDALIASDFGLFVRPEHRGGRHAIRLAREFMAWAKACGADLTRIGITTGVSEDRTAEFYRRALGMTHAGTILEARSSHVRRIP